MTASPKASAWFFGLFVVCSIVGLIAKVVDLSSKHAAPPASDAAHAKQKE